MKKIVRRKFSKLIITMAFAVAIDRGYTKLNTTILVLVIHYNIFASTVMVAIDRNIPISIETQKINSYYFVVIAIIVYSTSSIFKLDKHSIEIIYLMISPY